MNIFLSIIVFIFSTSTGYFIAHAYLDKSIPEASFARAGNIEIAENQIANLIGFWQRISDQNSIKIFKKNSIAKDVYDGEIIGSGTWEVIKDTEEANMKGTFIKTLINNEGNLYKVISATKSKLTLTNISRGSTIHYIRVVE